MLLGISLFGFSTSWHQVAVSQSGRVLVFPTTCTHTHTRQVMTKSRLPAVVVKRRMGRHVR